MKRYEALKNKPNVPLRKVIESYTSLQKCVYLRCLFYNKKGGIQMKELRSEEYTQALIDEEEWVGMER